MGLKSRLPVNSYTMVNKSNAAMASFTSEAKIDGVPATLWKANYGFQALEVPAGRHSITITYDDVMFTVGSSISGAVALGCAAAWGLRRRTAAV